MRRRGSRREILAAGAGVMGLAEATMGAGRARGRWNEAEAERWSKRLGWLVGCNFCPAYAINQLEMWQEDTFDLREIERELDLAQGLGFNSLRVFLHHLLWQQDSRGFVQRVDAVLASARRRGIGFMLVPLDGVWDPFPKLGKQRDPRPHVHNSGWVQSPGVEILKDRARHGELEGYIRGLVGHFRTDRRVHAWDLFNEPDNVNRPAYHRFEPEEKPALALDLLRKVMEWARMEGPEQPLTAGVWLGPWNDPEKLSPIDRYMLDESDIISFHNYGDVTHVRPRVDGLRRYRRPILCTEYMARPQGSTFENVLPYFKEAGVAAYNWGFVAGKSQTIYPWDTWTRQYQAEPPVWFHDIFRRDGTPYRQEEVDLIRRLTGVRKS